MNTLFPKFHLPCIRMTRIPGYKKKRPFKKNVALNCHSLEGQRIKELMTNAKASAFAGPPPWAGYGGTGKCQMNVKAQISKS